MSGEPCPMLAQIDHIALAADDVEGARAFYRLLGAMAAPFTTDPETGLRHCILDFCGVRLELYERPRSREGMPEQRPRLGLLHLGFALGSADAVDELSAVVADAGYRLLEPPHRAGGLGRYESLVLDPAGNRIKLTV